MAVSVNFGQRICERGKWSSCRPVENESGGHYLVKKLQDLEENNVIISICNNIVLLLCPVFFYHANKVQKNCKKGSVCRCGDARPFFCPLERGWYPWATNGHYPCSTTHYYSMPSWHAIFQFAGMAWPGGMIHGTSRKRSSAWKIYAVPSNRRRRLRDAMIRLVS